MLVIRPTLQSLDMWSEDAESLLLGTFAQESHMGYWLKQTTGPALGIGQMEPLTHTDCWRYLDRRKDLRKKITKLTGYKEQQTDETLIWDLRYAVIMSRIRYWMISKSIPHTLEEQAEYWDIFYNRNPDKGKPIEYVENYRRFVT